MYVFQYYKNSKTCSNRVPQVVGMISVAPQILNSEQINCKRIHQSNFHNCVRHNMHVTSGGETLQGVRSGEETFVVFNLFESPGKKKQIFKQCVY